MQKPLTETKDTEQSSPTLNQCDGCRIKAPLTPMGNHQYPDGSFIGCTKELYEVLDKEQKV